MLVQQIRSLYNKCSDRTMTKGQFLVLFQIKDLLLDVVYVEGLNLQRYYRTEIAVQRSHSVSAD